MVLSSPVRGDPAAARHHLRRLVQTLMTLDATVTVIGPADPGVDGATFAPAPGAGLPSLLLAQIPLAAEVVRRRGEFDHLLMTIGCQPFALVAVVGRALGVRVALLMLGSAADIRRATASSLRDRFAIGLLGMLEGITVSLSHRVGIESRSLATVFRVHAGMRLVPGCLLPVDLSAFHCGPRYEDRQRIALFVGRFATSKGIPALMRAIAMLPLSTSPFALEIVGDGPLRADLERWAGASGRPHPSVRVELLPWLDQAGVAQRMRAARVLVIPSVSEGVPTVLLEAMAAGAIPVASAVGGIPDVVTPERTGLLVAPGDATALASAITAGLDHPDGVALQAACRETVEGLVDMRSIRGAFAKLLDLR